MAIDGGTTVCGMTQLENGGSFHSYVNVYQRVLQQTWPENPLNGGL